MKAIYACGNMLSKKFSMCSAEVKAKLFRSYCSSLYCSALWSNYKVTTLTKLQTSYNNVLHHFFKLDRKASISAKCLELNVDCFRVILRKSIFSMTCRALV